MNNKELIKAGHELAKAISNDTPLIEIAKMVSNLATQLDVQLARSNALAAENAGLKAALRPSDIPSEWTDAFGDTAVIEHDSTGDNQGHSVSWSWVGNQEEVIKSVLLAVDKGIETPATDAFLAEVRASAVDEVCLKISNAIINCYQDEMVGLDEAATICGDFAAQLRKGGATEERQSFLSDEDRQVFVKAFTKGAAQ